MMNANRPLRILGLDPGLRRTGCGLIEVEGNRLIFVACGSVATSDKLVTCWSDARGGNPDVYTSVWPIGATAATAARSGSALASSTCMASRTCARGS